MAAAVRAEVLLIEWLDAAAVAPHWADGTKPDAPELTTVLSVGFVSHRTEDIIQLLQTTNKESHMHAIDIPRCMIVSVTPMRYGKKQKQ